MENNWNQLIERYLNGELSADGKEAFEAELSKSPSLQQELELHKLTQDLIKRSALRTMVVKRGKFHHLKKTITTTGIVVLIVAAIATAVLLTTGSSNPSSENSSTDEVIETALLEEMTEELGFENITPEYFKFTGENDVFLSESGVLLSITDNSFLLDGNPYSGEAVIQWQEAQTAAEIVKAGLSTTSGDKLLETQGMFTLNAFTPEGKQLELSDKGIYVQVPVAEQKDGMMLFNGVKGEDGKVDWQNQQKMERLPVPKSMADIDLFPPKYEPKLNELKWFTDKSKRDSLYLSFDETADTVIGNPAWGTANFSAYKSTTHADIASVPSDWSPERNRAQIDSLARLGYWISADRTISKIERPEDKVCWEFSLEKIKGTNEAWVVANVTVAEGWYIHSIYRPVNSFGPPTQFALKESANYEVISDPVEPKPIIEYDQLADENLSYHVGQIRFKQKIRITGKNGLISGKYGYVTCKVKEHCLPPFEANFVLPMTSENLEKSHIPPSKVLAIWNTKFDNTILATQDFEKRMKAIHNTCDESVFDIYANNLNEPLWKLDEKVVRLGYPEFQKFADEHVGKLNLNNAHQQNLKLFYEQATKTIREKGKNATLSTLKKEQKWNSDLNDSRKDEVYRKGMRESMNRQEESAFNLQNVSRQMGIVKSFTISRSTFPPVNSNAIKQNPQRDYSKKEMPGKPKAVKTQTEALNYRAFTGPYILNIDSQVANATTARKTSTIKDYHGGKKGEISYSSLTATVNDYKQYDKLFFYLFSKETASYQRLDFTSGVLNYLLNDDMHYTSAIVGMNENGFFLNEIGEAELRLHSVTVASLEKVSEQEFDKRINAMNSERMGRPMEIQSELNWLFKEKANYKVQKQRQENAVFRTVVRPTIYTCESGEGEMIPEPSDPEILTIVEDEAGFPGGLQALTLYLNANMVYPQRALDEGISGRVYLRFVVSSTGEITNVKVTKGIPKCPECDAEAKRAVGNMPNWTPAKNNGKNVAMWYNLPIKFNVNGGGSNLFN